LFEDFSGHFAHLMVPHDAYVMYYLKFSHLNLWRKIGDITSVLPLFY
jgi:hypothetical protein